MKTSDAAFAGSIPKIYETMLVPLIFEPYAQDLAARAKAIPNVKRVLEIACGTGVVTRALAKALPASVEIVATDLNPAMLEQAAAVGTSRPVKWQQADAMALGFADASFDLVVCQYGVMFFPDRAKAYAGIRRVLRPGGTFLFNAWGSLAANPLALDAQNILIERFPADPPRFLERTPYSYFDHARIAADLKAGGFTAAPRIENVKHTARAKDARSAAIAFCQGTPLRIEIESRDKTALSAVTDAATAAIQKRYGTGEIASPIEAVVVSVSA